MKNTSKRYSPEVQQRAIRLVFDHQAEYPSQWAAVQSIADKIGCTHETLRRWVRQAERDQGKRAGSTTDERERVKALERENAEYLSIRYTERLAEAGIEPSVGSVGDSTITRWPKRSSDSTRPK